MTTTDESVLVTLFGWHHASGRAHEMYFDAKLNELQSVASRLRDEVANGFGDPVPLFSDHTGDVFYVDFKAAPGPPKQLILVMTLERPHRLMWPTPARFTKVVP